MIIKNFTQSGYSHYNMYITDSLMSLSLKSYSKLKRTAQQDFFTAIFCMNDPQLVLKIFLNLILWRPCNFSPIDSLTGPLGQPFASHLGLRFASWRCTNSQWNGFLLLALSRYIGDPNMIDFWPCPMLRANNEKLHQASHQRCEKPAVITYAFPRFHSTPCRSSSSSQHSDRLEPHQVVGGEPCGGPAILLSLTGPVGQLFASRLGGQWFASWGCTNSQWNRVSFFSTVTL